MSYQSFVKLAGQPSWASSPLSVTISSLPPVGDVGGCEISEVPTIKELGYGDIEQVWNKYNFIKWFFLEFFVRRSSMQDEFSPFRGGESEALKRLKESINNKVLIVNLAL